MHPTNQATAFTILPPFEDNAEAKFCSTELRLTLLLLCPRLDIIFVNAFCKSLMALLDEEPELLDEEEPRALINAFKSVFIGLPESESESESEDEDEDDVDPVELPDMLCMAAISACIN